MKYNKPPISVADQLSLLKSRGLQVANDDAAKSYLSNISYYRLRAYTYPFQNNADPNHPFTVLVSIEEIISLYVFDRKLRMLVFDTIEKIEIAMRTQIIYTWAMKYGCHWHTDASLYRNSSLFAKHLTSLQTEIERSNETFIEHYKKKYTNPLDPPCWMSLEVSSFGLLSLMFLNLKKDGGEKKEIAKYFGLNDVQLLENWMHCFSNIRNICAHHGRLWNRRLTAHIKFPTYTKFIFLKNQLVYPYKLYAALACMQYVLQIISPQNTFNLKLRELMKKCPLKQEKEMGFPSDWKDESLWQ